MSLNQATIWELSDTIVNIVNRDQLHPSFAAVFLMNEMVDILTEGPSGRITQYFLLLINSVAYGT